MKGRNLFHFLDEGGHDPVFKTSFGEWLEIVQSRAGELVRIKKLEADLQAMEADHRDKMEDFAEEEADLRREISFRRRYVEKYPPGKQYLFV